MEISEEEIRRTNFNARVAAMGGQSEFISATGYNQGQVSSWQSGRKNIGAKAARKIERLAKWPRGTLDEGIGDPLDAVESAFLRMPYVDDNERDHMLWHLKRLRDRSAREDDPVTPED